MVRKKTKLVLPGGIQGLVHDVQQKASEAGLENKVKGENSEKEEIQKRKIFDPMQKAQGSNDFEKISPSVSVVEKGTDVSSADKNEQAGESREYNIVKDESKDNWDLFLNLARDYKTKQGKLSTVYIDSSLKDILDRLRTAEGIKLPSSAILSSIVARFVYDHEGNIRQALFGDHKLL